MSHLPLPSDSVNSDSVTTLEATPAHAFITRLIALLFTIWGAFFIYRSSMIALDGRRYFALFDDAMISMRYGWNLAHGLGLVWNPGERIQGYSNLLMTLLMALPSRFLDKSSAVLAIQILGVIFMLAIAYVARQIAAELLRNESPQRQDFVKVAAFVCTLGYYPLAYWSLMGMETGLLTLLLLSGLLAALRYARTQRATHLFATSALLSLAYMTRNDSLVLALMIGLYLLWEALTPVFIAPRRPHTAALAGESWPQAIAPLLPAALLYLLVVAGQSGFQYLYYGDFFPNTYTLKLTGVPFFFRIYNGIRFVLRFGVESALILFIPTAALIIDSFNHGSFSHLPKQKYLLLAIVFAALGYQIYTGGESWNYWRMMAPSIPLAFILTADALLQWAERLRSRAASLRPAFWRITPRQGNFAVAALLLLALLATDLRFLPEITFVAPPFQANANHQHVNIALALNAVTTSDATVGVLWAGIVPYYTERKGIDFLGKMDRYIATLPPDLSGAIHWVGVLSVPGHNKYDLDYSIKELQPTYVERFRWGRQNVEEWAKAHYVLAAYQGVVLALAKDSPAVQWDKVTLP